MKSIIESQASRLGKPLVWLHASNAQMAGLELPPVVATMVSVDRPGYSLLFVANTYTYLPHKYL